MTELAFNATQPAGGAAGVGNGLYLNAHQTREREPTAAENAIGDVIEQCYAAGLHDAPSLVDALNKKGVPGPGGAAWTLASFEAEMARLGA